MGVRLCETGIDYGLENMMKKSLFVLALCIAITSCEYKLKDIVFDNTSLPFKDYPISVGVYDTYEEPYISLNWHKDESADYYVLLRAKDAKVPDYKEIYRGKNVGFKDKDSVLTEGEKYLYRLDKIKKGIRYNSDRATYIYFDSKASDGNENDTKERAVGISGTINSVVYDVTFEYGAKDIKAKDWYKVTLGSGYKAFFKFIQGYPGVETSGAESGLRVFVLGRDIEKRVLKQGEEIEIANTTQKDDEFYFYIESRDDTSAKNARVYKYTLTLERITK